MSEKKQNQNEQTFNSVHDVLHFIQKNLKVPKLRENTFGKYKFRNCEDILDAAKTILPDGATLIIQDDIRLVGERYYVQALAKLSYKGESVENCSYAREDEAKKGMDASQLTGATSSYARKYALNGLFMIDDTKDADETNKHGKTEEDQKALDAIGGNIRDGVDAQQVAQMYNQALKDINNAIDLKALEAVWIKINKGIKVFSQSQKEDLTLAKDQRKFEIENNPPF